MSATPNAESGEAVSIGTIGVHAGVTGTFHSANNGRSASPVSLAMVSTALVPLPERTPT